MSLNESEKKVKNNSDADSSLTNNGKKEEAKNTKDSSTAKTNQNAPDKTKKDITLSKEEYQKLHEDAQKGGVYYDKFLRVHAELENIQKRTEKEKTNYFQMATETVISKILPVVDNFDRAVDSIETTKPEDIKHFLSGVELTRKELHKVLSEIGAERLETVGQKFNPHFHEAIMVENTKDATKDDIILAQIQAGYKLNGKLLRPAKVKVGRYTKE